MDRLHVDAFFVILQRLNRFQLLSVPSFEIINHAAVSGADWSESVWMWWSGQLRHQTAVGR